MQLILAFVHSCVGSKENVKELPCTQCHCYHDDDDNKKWGGKNAVEGDSCEISRVIWCGVTWPTLLAVLALLLAR